jgi:hypothetical protein
MVLVLLTAALIGLAMLAMAVGTIFSRRCLRGSCGGPDVLGPDGQTLTCDTCPRRRTPDAPFAAALPDRADSGPGPAARLAD